jgi:hypothetical protein
LLPTGDVVSLGAKTMKNVAGYDAGKLLIGSWGTLGIILDVTFRLFPYPAVALKGDPAPRPFVFRDLHKRIKKAFDPADIMALRTSGLTEAEIQSSPKGESLKKRDEPAERTFQTYGDKFWL